MSWFSDYQARRAGLRYRPTGQKGTIVLHLNGSALAVPRLGGAHRERPPAGRQRGAARGAVAVPARPPVDHGAGDGMSLADRRTDYDWGTLERDDLDDDPIVQWWTWSAPPRQRASRNRAR